MCNELSKSEKSEKILEFYKVYDNYHNIKEQNVWLIASVYTSFSIGVIVWILKEKCIVDNCKCYLVLFITLIFIFAQLYAGSQNWYKAKSVIITNNLNSLIKELDIVKDVFSFSKIIDAINPKRKKCIWKNSTDGYSVVCEYCRNGKAGIIAQSAMLMFFLAQLCILCKTLTN
jgi:hypothetical protein